MSTGKQHMHESCQRLEIKKKTTSPNIPKSNSVEKFHKTFNSSFQVYLTREELKQVIFLPMAILAYKEK